MQVTVILENFIWDKLKDEQHYRKILLDSSRFAHYSTKISRFSHSNMKQGWMGWKGISEFEKTPGTKQIRKKKTISERIKYFLHALLCGSSQKKCRLVTRPHPINSENGLLLSFSCRKTAYSYVCFL